MTFAYYRGHDDRDNHRWQTSENHEHDHHYRDHDRNVSGAPGPIAGAGLPVLVLGYGVYWLVRRRRS